MSSPLASYKEGGIYFMKSKYQRYTKETIHEIVEDLTNPNIKLANETARSRGLEISSYINTLSNFVF